MLKLSVSNNKGLSEDTSPDPVPDPAVDSPSGSSCTTSPQSTPPLSPTHDKPTNLSKSEGQRLSPISHGPITSKVDSLAKGDRWSASRRSYTEGQRSEDAHPHTEGHIRLMSTIAFDSAVMACRFSPDGDRLAVGLANGIILIHSMEGGDSALLYRLKDTDTTQSNLPVTSLRFVTRQQPASGEQALLLATYASGMIKFWHYTSGSCLQTIKEAHQTLCSSVNTMKSRLVTGGSDTQMHIYDMETRSKILTLEPSDARDIMNGHRLRVFSVQYHPTDYHLLCSGGWDDTVQFWDDRQKHATRRLYGPHICGDALDIDAHHNHILTGSWRNNQVLQIWDYESGARIKDVPQDALHKSMLYCAQWLGKDYIICGGTDQNMARIIDRGTLNTVAQLVDLEQSVYCIDSEKAAGHSTHPRIAVGASTHIYILRQDK